VGSICMAPAWDTPPTAVETANAKNPQRKRTDRAEGSADLPAIDIVRFAGRNLRDATAGDAGVLMAKTHLGACLYTLAWQHKYSSPTPSPPRVASAAPKSPPTTSLGD
jgi:hypothetical protein